MRDDVLTDLQLSLNLPFQLLSEATLRRLMFTHNVGEAARQVTNLPDGARQKVSPAHGGQAANASGRRLVLSHLVPADALDD